MRVLLDTHAFLWWLDGDPHLAARPRRIIAQANNTILVSAASAWEIAAKVRLGRLPGAEKLEREFLDVMEDTGYTPIPIDAAVALRGGRFLAEHRDPFDRVLAAQALADDIPILSADAKLDSFVIHRIW